MSLVSPNLTGMSNIVGLRWGWPFCLLVASPTKVDLALSHSCFLLCMCLSEYAGKFISSDFVYEFSCSETSCTAWLVNYVEARIASGLFLQKLVSMRKPQQA